MSRNMIYIGVVCHDCQIMIENDKQIHYDVDFKNDLEYNITLCEECKAQRDKPFWKRWLGV